MVYIAPYPVRFHGMGGPPPLNVCDVERVPRHWLKLRALPTRGLGAVPLLTSWNTPRLTITLNNKETLL